MTRAVEQPALEPSPERALALEPFLRRRFELQRQRQAGRAPDARIGERSQQVIEPSLFRDRIVVSERDQWVAASASARFRAARARVAPHGRIER